MVSVLGRRQCYNILCIEVYRLRTEWRIIGSLVGSLPLQPHQNNQFGLPLLLSPDEMSLLRDKGLLSLSHITSHLYTYHYRSS